MNYGVPHWSIIGPLLWDIMNGDLVSVDLGWTAPGYSSATLVVFADDVAVIATGKTAEILETTTNSKLGAVSQWMMNSGLKKAANNMEALMLTTNRGYDVPKFQILDTII